MDVTSLGVFLLIGLVAGALAGRLMSGGGFGLVGDLIVGVVGALIGGYLLGPYMPITGLVGAILTATLGACIFILLIRVVKRA